MIYPKAHAPLTETVIQMANDRAERWRVRYSNALKRISELEKELENAQVKD